MKLYQALNEFGFLSGESRTVQTAAIPNYICSFCSFIYIAMALEIVFG